MVALARSIKTMAGPSAIASKEQNRSAIPSTCAVNLTRSPLGPAHYLILSVTNSNFLKFPNRKPI